MEQSQSSSALPDVAWVTGPSENQRQKNLDNLKEHDPDAYALTHVRRANLEAPHCSVLSHN